jgi:transposase
MEAIVERCCGLDVHQAKVVACVLIGTAAERARKEIRSFGTFTRDLLALRDWLRESGVTLVGMESTGVYWKPVYGLLEDDFSLVVGNAFHIKNVPGRKTDVKDAEWIADLLRHGLIKSSFVPPQPIRALRELVRYRRKLTESRSTERNRLLKLLETANIKVSSVASNVFGKSGMLMLQALAAGEADAAAMAALARGQLRKKTDALAGALDGRVDEDHRFLLNVQLERLARIDGDLAKVDARIELKMAPYQEEENALPTIPGVGKQTARALIAEVGVDMSAFPNEHHLAAWAGVAPGNYESAGKRLGGRARKGNMHLRTSLVEAAKAATRKTGSYLRAKYYRIKARRGMKRAAIAIAHQLVIAVYHILSKRVPYRELGEGYHDSRARTRSAKNLVRRLESLGFTVQIEPPTPTNA